MTSKMASKFSSIEQEGPRSLVSQRLTSDSSRKEFSVMMDRVDKKAVIKVPKTLAQDLFQLHREICCDPGDTSVEMLVCLNNFLFFHLDLLAILNGDREEEWAQMLLQMLRLIHDQPHFSESQKKTLIREMVDDFFSDDEHWDEVVIQALISGVRRDAPLCQFFQSHFRYIPSSASVVSPWSFENFLSSYPEVSA